jgi:hypothetical protein
MTTALNIFAAMWLIALLTGMYLRHRNSPGLHSPGASLAPSDIGGISSPPGADAPNSPHAPEPNSAHGAFFETSQNTSSLLSLTNNGANRCGTIAVETPEGFGVRT